MLAFIEQKYRTGDVIAAAGVSNDDIQNWIKRKVIIGQRKGEVEGGGGAGKFRQFTFFNAVEVATAAALIRAGYAVADAFRVAQKFSHTNAGSEGDEGQLVGDAPSKKPVRHAGLPFHYAHGDTYLFVSGDHSEILLDGLEGDTALTVQAVKSALSPRGERPESWITVNMSLVFARVIHGLGLGDARQILDAVYSETAA